MVNMELKVAVHTMKATLFGTLLPPYTFPRDPSCSCMSQTCVAESNTNFPSIWSPKQTILISCYYLAQVN